MKGTAWSKDDVKMAKKLYAEGRTPAYIAAKVGFSGSGVVVMLKREGVTLRGHVAACAARNAMAKGAAKVTKAPKASKATKPKVAKRVVPEAA